MNKICTSIEQSQKLVELGIDIDTADMRYKLEQWIDDDDCPLQPIIYPCWSLSALLNYLREIDMFPEIEADEHNVKMSVNYYNEDEARPLAPIHNITVKAESVIDACYELIIKLHELNLL